MILDKHIMLSYNHQAKEEVNKMKERLREKGYKVWIDQEQITTGTMLQSYLKDTLLLLFIESFCKVIPKITHLFHVKWV